MPKHNPPILDPDSIRQIVKKASSHPEGVPLLKPNPVQQPTGDLTVLPKRHSEISRQPPSTPVIALVPAKPAPPTPKEILDKLKFYPVEELVKMFKEGRQTIVTKEGDQVEVDIDPALKVKILDTVMAYCYPKSKPSDAAHTSKGPPTVVIRNFGTIDITHNERTSQS